MNDYNENGMKIGDIVNINLEKAVNKKEWEKDSKINGVIVGFTPTGIAKIRWLEKCSLSVGWQIKELVLVEAWEFGEKFSTHFLKDVLKTLKRHIFDVEMMLECSVKLKLTSDDIKRYKKDLFDHKFICLKLESLNVLEIDNIVNIEEWIKHSAFEAKVDYKPWKENLNPKEYFEEGFKTGCKRLVQKIKNK